MMLGKAILMASKTVPGLL